MKVFLFYFQKPSQVKKDIIRRIIKEAAKLPIKLEKRKRTEYFTGKEVLEAHDVHDPESKLPRVNLKKAYPSTLPRVEEVDHVARMKTAYKAGGWKRVEAYINDNRSTGE